MLQTLRLKNQNTNSIAPQAENFKRINININRNINRKYLAPQAENFKSLTKKAEFLETRMGRAVVMMSLSLIKWEHKS